MVQKVIERSDFSVNFSSKGEKPNKKLNRDDGNFPNGKIQLLGPVDPHSKTLIAQIQKKEYLFLCEIIVGLALTLISVYLSRKKNDSIRLFSWVIGIEVVSSVVQISALFFKNYSFKQNNDKAIQEFNFYLATKAVINDNYKNFWMKRLFWIPSFTLAPVIKIDFIKLHGIMILSVHALQNTIQIFLLIGRDFSSKEDSLENTIKRHFSLSEKMAHLSAVTITFIRVIPLSIIN